MFWLVVLAIFWALLFWDRFDLWQKARKLPGPAFSIPFIGQTVQMVMQPFKFYERQEKLGPMSWNSAGGKYVYTLAFFPCAQLHFHGSNIAFSFVRFIMFSQAAGITRNVFNNAKGSLRLWLIFGAEKILGKVTRLPHNLLLNTC